MRIVAILALLSFGGCASHPTQCVGVPSEWAEVDAPAVGTEIVLQREFSDRWKLDLEEDQVRWYRRPDESYFACIPGWDEIGCGQETYKIMLIDDQWQGIFFDGIVCTG